MVRFFFSNIATYISGVVCPSVCIVTHCVTVPYVTWSVASFSAWSPGFVVRGMTEGFVVEKITM